MPESANFNVAVVTTLRNRISQGLRAIGRDFGSTERRVQQLQRSLNDLQTRHGIYAQRVRVTQALERQGTAGLERRLALMQAAAASEQTVRQAKIEAMQAESAERSRMERIEAEQLRGLQRRTALQKLAARDARDAQRIQMAQQELQTSQQARQLQITELQGNIQRRNALAQLRATEAENALLRRQNALRERQAALAAENARARVAGKLGALSAVGIGAGAAAVAGYEVAKAGLPVSMYLQQIRMAGGLTQQQSRALPAFARNLAQGSRLFDYKEVLQALVPLVGRVGLAQTRALAPGVFALSALSKQYGFGDDLAQMAVSMVQTLATARATTGARRAMVLNAATAMLRHGISPEDFEQNLQTLAPAMRAARIPFAGRLRAAELATAVQALGGTQAGVSATAVGNIFRELMLPSGGKMFGLISLLESQKSHPLARDVSKRTFQNITEAISHANFQTGIGMRIMAGEGGTRTLIALQNILRTPAFTALETALRNSVTPQQALALSLTTAAPAMTSLGKSLDTFASVAGSILDSPLGKLSNAAAGRINRAASSVQRSYDKYGYFGADARAVLFGLERQPGVLLLESLWKAAARGIAATPPGITPSGQPIHVHVHLDGKEIARGTTKHTVNFMKDSALSFGSGASPSMSPHVVAPKLTP